MANDGLVDGSVVVVWMARADEKGRHITESNRVVVAHVEAKVLPLKLQVLAHSKAAQFAFRGVRYLSRTKPTYSMTKIGALENLAKSIEGRVDDQMRDHANKINRLCAIARNVSAAIERAGGDDR